MTTTVKGMPLPLTKHEIKVARAILAEVFGFKTTRTRLGGDDYVYATVDGAPREAEAEASRKGWTRVPTVHASFWMIHPTWPGAVMEICYNDFIRGRDTQVAVFKSE